MNTQFTLDEILFANRYLFPETLEKLWTKHTGDPDEARYMASLLKSKGNFLNMIQEFGAYKTDLLVFTELLNELTKKT
jgi:hypothetical protein